MTTIAGHEVEQKASEPKASGQEQPHGEEGERPTAMARREKIDKSLERVEHTVERMSKALQRPVLGASVAGGLVAAAAGLWGATEAALGAFVGVLAYRMLKRRYRARERARAEQAAPAVAG